MMPHITAAAYTGFSSPGHVPKQRHILQATGNHLCAILLAAALQTSPSAIAATPQPSLDDAIVQVSRTSYPIIKALRAETFVPFTEKIAELFQGLPQEELGVTIALGVDVFDSVPDEAVKAFSAVVKDAFADLSTDSCTLVPLPSPTSAKAFGEIASRSVDSAKLRGVTAKWAPTLEALPIAGGGASICLPPVETLDQLALAQAEIGRSFGVEEGRRLGSYAKPFLALAIKIEDALPLLTDAKKLAPTATNAEKTAFRFAGTRIEAVVQRENRAREKADKDAAIQQGIKARDAAMQQRIAASRAAGS